MRQAEEIIKPIHERCPLTGDDKTARNRRAGRVHLPKPRLSCETCATRGAAYAQEGSQAERALDYYLLWKLEKGSREGEKRWAL